MKYLGRGLLAALGLAVCIWVILGFQLGTYKFWAPKQEEARREVFTETPSYVLGKNQFLTRLHSEWKLTEDPGHKAILCANARHEAATIDREDLTGSLQAWRCTR